MRKCREFAVELALYRDGELSADRRAELDRHLSECPLCRQRVDDYSILLDDLRSLSSVGIPGDLADAVKARVYAEASATGTHSPSFRLIDRRRQWTEIWLLPSLAGCAATAVLAVLLGTFIITAPPGLLSARETSSPNFDRPIYLATNYLDVSPNEYAYGRLGISAYSPSINPRGSLVQLTRSLVSERLNDDEVTVVADVFENGLAQIAEVVEPSGDRKVLNDLQKALENDPAFAPFVPASLDQRSDTVRVVLKIQNVSVRTGGASE